MSATSTLTRPSNWLRAWSRARVLTVDRALTTFMIRNGPGHPLTRLVMSLRCRRRGAEYVLCEDGVEIRKGNRAIRIAPNQFLHALEISRLFESYFSQVVPQSRGSEQVVDYSRPKLHHYAQSGLAFELASFPEEQSAIDDYFRWYMPRAGDTIFDIGAYCGVSAYHFSKRVGATGRVFAFEPDPANYELLVRNIERHQLSNVTPVNLAVAGSSGILKFNAEASTGGGLAHAMPRIGLGRVIDVEALTLEEACTRYGLPQLIKIDVEGAEIEIIAPAVDFIRAHRLAFVIDTSHFLNGTLTYPSVENLFLRCGYESFSSDEAGMMTTWARIRTPSDRSVVRP